MKLVFDSNVFDDFINEKLELKVIEENNYETFITHIQIDEINECADKEKRARLLNSITEIRPKTISTESFIIGTSRLDYAKPGSDDLIEKLRTGNHKKTNDALIGETAIKNKLTLVTNDKKLKNKVIDSTWRRSNNCR